MNNAEEKQSKQIWLRDIYPVLVEIVEQGGEFKLTVTGTSMFPTLLGGRDCVTLIKAPAQLKRNDLPLYRRRDGSFVLHRVVDVAEDGSYTMCGDHQWVKEPGIRPEQIVALVSAIDRKKKHFSVTDPAYLRWVRFWVWALPLRKSLFRAARIPGRVKRIFRKK